MEIKNYILPILALAAAIVVGYAIFTLGWTLMGHPEGNESEGGNVSEGANASALLLAALGKPANYQSYTYEYTDTMDGYPVTSRFVQGPGFSVYKARSTVFEKAVYFNATGRVLCITMFGNESCSEVAQSSTLNPTFDAMARMMPGAKAASDVKTAGVLIRGGAITFSKDIPQITVNGKACSQVRYTLDYTKLTLSDIEALGMSPNDPSLSYGSNYSFEYCIDNESNILSAALDYAFLGAPKHSQTVVESAKWGVADASEYSFPEPVNENATIDFFLSAIGAEKSVLSCSANATTKDGCLRQYALENELPDICLLAGAQKDKCLIILAPEALRGDLCGKIGNASMKDDCWTEIAGRKNDSSLCANVVGAAAKGNCLTIFAPECTKDSDCAKAGCSGQLCVPLSRENMTTTCEMRPEYSCLNLTSCGCVQGKCGWAQNSNYTGCVANAAAAGNEVQ
jgi:eight-cysteine-cluster-containing protein